MNENRDRRHDPRTPRPGPGFKPYPVPYSRFCGWCGGTHQVYTDGRMLVCGNCGH